MADQLAKCPVCDSEAYECEATGIVYCMKGGCYHRANNAAAHNDLAKAAELGRAVRAMPRGVHLIHDDEPFESWSVRDSKDHLLSHEETDMEALRAAGISK